MLQHAVAACGTWVEWAVYVHNQGMCGLSMRITQVNLHGRSVPQTDRGSCDMM